jgi:hypothetical protein
LQFAGQEVALPVIISHNVYSSHRRCDPLLNTHRLRTFARLIALGHPPAVAAKDAGYRNLRGSRAPARLTPQPAVTVQKATRAAAAAKKTAAADEARTQRPAPEPMMTEAQWLAAFHPMVRGETRAGP